MKPILFNTDMVKALLRREKTQTRRVIKPQPKTRLSYIITGDERGKWNYSPLCYRGVEESGRHEKDKWISGLTKEDENRCWTPPCCAGDVLYVRETWQNTGERYIYRADFDEVKDNAVYYAPGWRPSIHMPKEAARIFLRVELVSVERLQDMAEEDAEAEGFSGCPYEREIYFPQGGIEICANVRGACACHPEYWYCDHSLPEAFGRDVWDPTIKKADRDKYGWDANPWVFVIFFERIDKEEAMQSA